MMFAGKEFYLSKLIISLLKFWQDECPSNRQLCALNINFATKHTRTITGTLAMIWEIHLTFAFSVTKIFKEFYFNIVIT